MEEILGCNMEIDNKPEIVEIVVNKNDTPIESPKKEKRKYNKTKKSEKSNSDNEGTIQNISALMMAGFGIASSRLGDHWNINSKEANSIAIPLTKILDKYNLLEKAENISDPLALIIAVGTITIPRVIMTMTLKETNQQNVLEKNGGLQNGNRNSISSNSRTEQTDKKGNDAEFNIHDAGNVAERKSNDLQSVKDICSAVSI